MAKTIIGVNDLATTHPELAQEWHPTKNGTLAPDQVTSGSNKKVWWRCQNGHEWEAKINNRVFKNNSCPYCSGRKILPGYNDLATTHPKLAAEWHSTKNGDLTPQDVSKGTTKKIWWLGPCGHEWEDTVGHRTGGRSCPVCAGKQIRVGHNDLATTHPELAAEWHPTKNGALLPSQVSKSANKVVWWRCANGHEWQVIHDNSGHPMIENVLKTESGRREVPITPTLHRELELWGEWYGKEGLVFATTEGEPLGVGPVNWVWSTIRKAAANYNPDYAKKFTAHSMRHTYITRLFEAGLDIKEIQTLAGHKDVTTTLSVYTHFDKEGRQQSTFAKVRSAFSGQPITADTEKATFKVEDKATANTEPEVAHTTVIQLPLRHVVNH